jgi:mono/diheme cytochrome c family protein
VTAPGKRPPSQKLEERRAAHQRYKEDVKQRGKPFYPYAMFHDTVMSLVVVAVIVALAVIWKFTAHHEGSDYTGWLGAVYSTKADPGTVNFVPRPDWYFYFLFYLLRIFKWPSTVILGTVGIPTILLILMLSLPFIDRRRERRLLRKPVAVVAAILVVISMGTLTYKGATAKEALGAELIGLVPSWAQKGGFAGNATAVEGAKLFAQSACLNCHQFQGVGGAQFGAPDLTAEGTRNRGIQWQIDHLRSPSAKTPGSPMPSFAGFSDQQLKELATFLEASKGVK